MKTQSLSVLALASVAAATGFGSSGSFNCPSNTNNECNTQQKPGYSWGDLNTGDFSSYGGMQFSGYKCQSSFGKRDGLTKRTFADSKCIKGKASADKASSPAISCGSSSTVPNKQFSVTEMHVSVEFDCDLEFHYDMPDKSTCKHTAGCSSAGSIVKNTQCGGATGVTVVYPSQSPGKNTGKTSCDVGIHSIGFDCGPASSSTIRASSTVKPSSSASKPTTVPTTLSSATKPTSTAVSTKPAESSKSTSENSGVTSSKPVSTKPAESTKVVESSTKVVESSSKVSESSKSVATTPASSKPIESTKVVESSTKPIESSKSTSENSGVTSSIKPVTNSTTPAVSIPTTTAPVQLTTSTIFTTSVSTIISCAESVKNCPANSQTTALVTVTIPVSTTICPVSEVTPGSKPTVSAPGSSSLVVPSSSSFVTSAKPTSVGENSGASSSVVKPSGSTSVFVPAPSDTITTVIISSQTTVCPYTSTHVTAGTTKIETGITTSTIPVTITSTVCSKCEAAKTSTAPAGPVTTAPGVPDVLPKCMNTWNFIVGCIDNTDASCYCPDTDFVNNVFGCLTAYGADASVVSAAASYFQGICAPYIPQNPAIVTACPSSSVPSVAVSSNSGAITTAPAVIPSVPVTTINVVQTITVPCVQSTGVSSGLIIPSSSTTTFLSTALTVPQVVFSTPASVSGNSGSTASQAVPVLVVGTPAAVVATTTPSKAAPAASTVPTSYAGSNGTAKASPVPTSPLTTNGGASMSVAFSSIFGAALLAVFVL